MNELLFSRDIPAFHQTEKVAGEVRTLAQRSATAARDIKHLIEEAVAQVESGVVVATGTGKSILDINAMVGKLAVAMDNISLASAEQMQGISQVSIAVNQMDGVTQNNAALVEESAAAAASLKQQAYLLLEGISEFDISRAGRLNDTAATIR